MKQKQRNRGMKQRDKNKEAKKQKGIKNITRDRESEKGKLNKKLRRNKGRHWKIKKNASLGSENRFFFEKKNKKGNKNKMKTKHNKSKQIRSV